MLVSVDTVSVAASLVVLVASLFIQHNRSFRTKVRITTLTIYTIGILIWPILWKHVIGAIIIANASSLMALSLLWPVISLGFEMYMMRYVNDDSHSKSKRNFLLGDGQSIISLTLAFASMLSIYSKPSNGKYSHIFLCAIIGCILVVMQTSHTFVDAMCIERIIVESMQKVCLVYSTGLLVAGIIALNDAQRRPTNGANLGILDAALNLNQTNQTNQTSQTNSDVQTSS